MTGPEASFSSLDPGDLPSPSYVIDVAKLEDNLRILRRIGDAADVKILLALKAFSCFAVANLIGSYLDGTAASGLWEARLGRERFRGEVHTFAAGLKLQDLAGLQSNSDHLIFNSLSQWQRALPLLKSGGACQFGIRVNPRHSEVATPLYDPCAPWSRLGVPPDGFEGVSLDGLSGIHVHALCDQGYEPFDRLLAATEQAFGWMFDRISWINLGGGQLLTAPDYPVDRLVSRLKEFRQRTGLEVYLEPGTAVALNAGALVTEVLDIGRNYGHFAIVDCSATCHMPDVIEAPFTPDVLGAETVDAAAMDAADASIIRLGGPTCLAGDVIGTYRFSRPPQIGDRLIVLDQAYYTMVKASTFNGTPLPAIALWDSRNDMVTVVREFDYEAFESRLS